MAGLRADQRDRLAADTDRVTREIADLEVSKKLEDAKKAVLAAFTAGYDNGQIGQAPTQRPSFASSQSYPLTPDPLEPSTVDQTVGVDF